MSEDSKRDGEGKRWMREVEEEGKDGREGNGKVRRV